MKRLLIILTALLYIPLSANEAQSVHATGLLQHITTIHAPEFEQRYAAAIVTPHEHAELLRTAQAGHTRISEEVSALKRANKSMNLYPIAKGVGQAYIALLSTLGAAVATMTYSHLVGIYILNTDILAPIIDKFKNYTQKYKLLMPSELVSFPICMFIQRAHFLDNTKTATALFAIPTLAAIYAAYYCSKHAISNIRTGLNYTQSLEVRIKNLDQIIEFLHAQDASAPGTSTNTELSK